MTNSDGGGIRCQWIVTGKIQIVAMKTTVDEARTTGLNNEIATAMKATAGKRIRVAMKAHWKRRKIPKALILC